MRIEDAACRASGGLCDVQELSEPEAGCPHRVLAIGQFAREAICCAQFIVGVVSISHSQ